MKKLTLALFAGCMSVAVGAYAASGAPDDTDRAGRMGPGTAAGQMGAVDPTPDRAAGTTGTRSSTGTRAGTATGATGATGTGGSSATTGGMGGRTGGERAPRAARG